MSKSKNRKIFKTFNAKAESLGLSLPCLCVEKLIDPSRSISFSDVADWVFSQHGEFLGGQAVVVAQLCENDEVGK